MINSKTDKTIGSIGLLIVVCLPIVFLGSLYIKSLTSSSYLQENPIPTVKPTVATRLPIDTTYIRYYTDIEKLKAYAIYYNGKTEVRRIELKYNNSELFSAIIPEKSHIQNRNIAFTMEWADKHPKTQVSLLAYDYDKDKFLEVDEALTKALNKFYQDPNTSDFVKANYSEKFGKIYVYPSIYYNRAIAKKYPIFELSINGDRIQLEKEYELNNLCGAEEVSPQDILTSEPNLLYLEICKNLKITSNGDSYPTINVDKQIISIDAAQNLKYY